MGSDDETAATAAARPASAAVSAVLAAVGALVMASALTALWPTASRGADEDALIAAVLMTIAGFGTMLCAYLVVIWSLAVMALLAGPASRTGVTVLLALRVLAPRVASRVTLGAAVATTATGLVLVPATAADPGAGEGDAARPLTTAVSSQLVPTAPSDTAPSGTAPSQPEHDPEPVAEAPGSTTDEDGDSPQLPPLGWGEQPSTGDAAPLNTDAADPEDTESSAAPAPAQEGSTPSTPPRTVEVHAGDSLWSITDDLLGPAPDDPSEIASAWPALHEANHLDIGPDPDHLEPGQELIVPASLSHQEH